MQRPQFRRDSVSRGAAARLLVAGAIGALLLLGALNPPPAGASSTAGDPAGEHSSYLVQHAVAVAPLATNPARSQRMALPGAFLVAAAAAALAARRIRSGDRVRGRRRAEQFSVRLRGPPHLLVARTH